MGDAAPAEPALTSMEAKRLRAVAAARDAALGSAVASAVAAPPPPATGDFPGDSDVFGRYWSSLAPALVSLAGAPEGAARTTQAALRDLACLSRLDFLERHVETVYRALTDGLRKFVRVEPLCYAAADLVPGLVPTRAEVDAELTLSQSDKIGFEMYQGMFVSRVMAHPECGHHLAHAMLLPLPTSRGALERFAADGRVELDKVTVERRGAAALVTVNNPDVLNSEDDTVLSGLETAVDVAILDPVSEIAVLRGGAVDHPKYGHRRIFGSGINLTRLYRGKIPFMFYLSRDFGLVNKMLRGLADPARDPDEESGGTREKPWIAAVESFAIGGACQLLLVMDYTIADTDAYLTLPARKEGIIPGYANLRLPRFVGDRIARQAILNDRRIECDSEAGRMICDEIVQADQMDSAIDRVVSALTSSGVVSAEGNRRAFRVGQESMDTFRRYGATMAREQAYCHFSPALIANLETHWNARNRKPA